VGLSARVSRLQVGELLADLEKMIPVPGKVGEERVEDGKQGIWNNGGSSVLEIHGVDGYAGS